MQQNRLALEKSPYLLQHKDNPVDWYPWGNEAFQKAQDEDKIIFLSVGYSTCHWCHVMERESFENEKVAQLMNDSFINIKVDREERPDVDKIYMTYVQATTGGGGWPMSVWLTPDLEPILGGTYYPPKGSYGRPGFSDIIETINTNWESNRDKLAGSGARVLALLKEHEGKVDKALDQVDNPQFLLKSLNTYYATMKGRFDARFGGFGDAPKFPRPVEFTGLFTCFQHLQEEDIIDMCQFTLEMMYMGGMHDAIAGGFHRYSVDREWHVPHFEKMLYDQGQLVNSYLTMYLLTKNELNRVVAEDILDYVNNCLLSPENGFYSAEDADSLIPGSTKKAEGAFYVWEESEIDSILGANSPIFKAMYTVKTNGNVKSDPHREFVNKNILTQRREFSDVAKEFDLSLEECDHIINESRDILNQIRDERPRPFLDDKIITAWNGLMISAFAKASSVLDRDDYLESAENAANFIKATLYQDGFLIRNFRGEASKVVGFAQDYAYLITGLIDLYEASANHKWLDWAVQLQEKMNELFYDEENGGFFATDGRDPSIVLRMKEDYDGAEPSENSYSLMNLVRLGNMLQSEKYLNMAKQTANYCKQHIAQNPIIMPHAMSALSLFIHAPRQIIIAGHPQSDDTRAMVRKIYEINHNFVLLYADQGEGQKFLETSGNEIMETIIMKEGKATAYVCENFTCSLPTTDLSILEELLK